MRVLQIYDHIGVNCGIMSVIMNWYRNIDRKKCQFDFLVSARVKESYEDEIISLGGCVYYMGTELTLKELPNIVCNTKKFMRNNAMKYSAFHLHSHTFAYPYLYYAKKYGGKKLIVHAHSISLGNTKLKNFRNRLFVFPLKYLADKCVACSDMAGNNLYHHLGMKKFDVILNGIEFDKYCFDEKKRKIVREKLGIKDTETAVIHISNMSKIKNVPFLLKVFSEMVKEQECKLILIGSDELPNEVKTEIETLNIGDYVINLGVRKDVPDLLQAADVCLMPSESEGLGLVAIESQAAGVPVITSNGFPEVVYVTDIIKRCELNVKLWSSESLKLSKLHKKNVDLDSAKEYYDIVNITKKIERLYGE